MLRRHSLLAHLIQWVNVSGNRFCASYSISQTKTTPMKIPTGAASQSHDVSLASAFFVSEMTHWVLREHTTQCYQRLKQHNVKYTKSLFLLMLELNTWTTLITSGISTHHLLSIRNTLGRQLNWLSLYVDCFNNSVCNILKSLKLNFSNFLNPNGLYKENSVTVKETCIYLLHYR